MDRVEQGFVGHGLVGPGLIGQGVANPLEAFVEDHVVADAPADYEAVMAAIPRFPVAVRIALVAGLAIGPWVVLFDIARRLIGR
jgi:hypothetical protein